MIFRVIVEILTKHVFHLPTQRGLIILTTTDRRFDDGDGTNLFLLRVSTPLLLELATLHSLLL